MVVPLTGLFLSEELASEMYFRDNSHVKLRFWLVRVYASVLRKCGNQ